MYEVSFTFDDDVIEATRTTAQTARARLRERMFLVVDSPAARRVIAGLATEPEPPDSPINWKNPRQRQAVMRKLRLAGMEGGYVRSHRLAQSWSMYLQDLVNGSGIIGVMNKMPYADYVQGESQQQFLYKWPLARKIIRDGQEAMQEEVVNAWLEVVTIRR